MQMGGAIIVTASGSHKIANRSVDRNRISGWLAAAESKMPLGVCHKLSAEVHRRLLWLLLFIKAFRRGVPDVDFCALNRIPLLIFHPAIAEKYRPGRWRAHNGRAVFGSR